MVTEPWSRRAVFAAGECTHGLLGDGEGSAKSHQRFLLCFVWMTAAASVSFTLAAFEVHFTGENSLLCLKPSKHNRNMVQ